MNAPHLCKFRKDYLTDIDHGAMVLTKRRHFNVFKLPKAEERPLCTCPIAEVLSFWSLDARIYNCKLRNKKKIYKPSVYWIFNADIQIGCLIGN